MVDASRQLAVGDGVEVGEELGLGAPGVRVGDQPDGLGGVQGGEVAGVEPVETSVVPSM